MDACILKRSMVYSCRKLNNKQMECWRKLAEIWTEPVHDPMNLLDNAIVGSRFVNDMR